MSGLYTPLNMCIFQKLHVGPLNNTFAMNMIFSEHEKWASGYITIFKE